jgi:hypothetical protein
MTNALDEDRDSGTIQLHFRKPVGMAINRINS